MDPRCQPLVVGDAPQQLSELRPFFFIQGGTKALFVRRGNAREFSEHLAPSLGEVQRVVAPVLRTPPTLKDSLCFEIVHQRDHAARHHPQMLRQCLLADPGVGRNLAQQARIRSRQPKLRNSFGKAARSVRPHLSQKKGGTRRASIGRTSVYAHADNSSIA
jgi:hypothetical protein